MRRNDASAPVGHVREVGEHGLVFFCEGAGVLWGGEDGALGGEFFVKVAHVFRAFLEIDAGINNWNLTIKLLKTEILQKIL